MLNDPVEVSLSQSDKSRLEGDEIFRLLVESVQDYAIFLLSPEGNIMTWNTGAQGIKRIYRSGNNRAAFFQVLCP
jgi:hypothetical protein